MQTFLLALRDGVTLKPTDVTKIPQSDLERLYPVYAGYYGSAPFAHLFSNVVEVIRARTNSLCILSVQSTTDMFSILSPR